MESLKYYQKIIKQVLEPYPKIPYSHGDLMCKAIFDDQTNSYLLVTLGWDGHRRVHGCLVHIDIIDDKVWIQRDETEDGIARDLLAAGIPKSQIVLGFHPADVRPHTGYAVA